MGDFVEAFDDDAATVARVCDLTLHTRTLGRGDCRPMAGFLHAHQAANIAKLRRAGHRVALVERDGGGPLIDVDGLGQPVLTEVV